MPVDPLRHPDLARIGRRMREQLDDTLEAEQHAARAAALRRRTLRDVLLEAEDRRALAVCSLTDGYLYRGTVASVGTDHVAIDTETGQQILMLGHLVSVDIR